MKSTRELQSRAEKRSQCNHHIGERPRRMRGATCDACPTQLDSRAGGWSCCLAHSKVPGLAIRCQMLSCRRLGHDKMKVDSMWCKLKSQELARELADFDRMPNGEIYCSRIPHAHQPGKQLVVASNVLSKQLYRKTIQSNLVFISLICLIAKHSVTTTQAIMPSRSSSSPTASHRQLAAHSWHRSRDEQTSDGQVNLMLGSPIYRSVNDEDQPGDSDETQILTLHKQLNALRRQLERALRKQHNNNNNSVHDDGGGGKQVVEARITHQPRPIRLGSPCLATSECAQSVKFSHCKLDTFTCSCLDQHVELNSTSCLPPALLGYECALDAQCQQKVPESVCQLGKCACRSTEQFVAHRNSKCLSAARINDYCLADGQCHLNDKHSYCKWKIPNVYGTCKCPPNYKLLPQDNDNSRVQCVPRLGDTCLSDRECQLATKNSICRDVTQSSTNDAIASKTTTPRRRNYWLSSSASGARCTCASGFVWSASQLECHEEVREEQVKLSENVNIDQRSKDSANTTTATTQALESHKYETVIAKEDQQQVTQTAAKPDNSPSELEIKFVPLQVPPSTIATSTTTTTERPPSSVAKLTTTTTTTTAPVVTTPGLNDTITGGGFRMSSLGKPCNSRRECQARDPYSDCLGGICECQVPSERCRASSTGCHPGTFQCRNGQCISWYFVCDQFRNCDDGSDEEACHSSSSPSSGGCPPESFQCHSGGACLTRGKVCNGKRDCSDGSDEIGCAGGGQTPPALGRNSSLAPGGCPANTFTCYNGQCLPAYVFCNAVEDCADASDEDERLCGRGSPSTIATQLPPESTSPQSSSSMTTTTTTTSTTSKPQVQLASSSPAFTLTESPLVKTDRASIERLMAALVLTQRTPDKRGRKAKMAADKKIVTSTTTTARPIVDIDECPRWAFTCRNGKCRSSAILCSGVDGCGDNSDEDRCEVCQCEPPPPAEGKPQRAALARRQQHEGGRRGRGELNIIRHAPNVARA